MNDYVLVKCRKKNCSDIKVFDANAKLVQAKNAEFSQNSQKESLPSTRKNANRPIICKKYKQYQRRAKRLHLKLWITTNEYHQIIDQLFIKNRNKNLNSNSFSIILKEQKIKPEEYKGE